MPREKTRAFTTRIPQVDRAYSSTTAFILKISRDTYRLQLNFLLCKFPPFWDRKATAMRVASGNSARVVIMLYNYLQWMRAPSRTLDNTTDAKKPIFFRICTSVSFYLSFLITLLWSRFLICWIMQTHRFRQNCMHQLQVCRNEFVCMVQKIVIALFNLLNHANPNLHASITCIHTSVSFSLSFLIAILWLLFDLWTMQIHSFRQTCMHPLHVYKKKACVDRLKK